MIIIIIIALIITIVVIIEKMNTIKLVKMFEDGNVIVFGKKRKGKDLLFNKVINARKRLYYANIPYNKKGYNKLEINEFSIKSDYNDFIKGEIDASPSPITYDNTDFYISDAGIYLPSQYDATLSKEYKTLPIIYALSSQVWKCNIHINTQALNRVWIKLREQADTYIKVRKTIKIFNLLITLYTTYDKYDSANNDIRPISKRLLNSYSTAEVDKFNSLHGEIKNGFIVQRTKKIYYDTHHFRNVILDNPPKLDKYNDKKYKIKKR